MLNVVSVACRNATNDGELVFIDAHYLQGSACEDVMV